MFDFRSAAIVLLVVAAADAIIDAIEYYTLVDLWQPLAILGLILLAIDMILRLRGTHWTWRPWRRRTMDQSPAS